MLFLLHSPSWALGMLGKKSGKGFYVYENGRSKGFNEELPSLLGTEGRRFNRFHTPFRLSLPPPSTHLSCVL